MFINHCGNVKVNNNEDKKLSTTNCDNNDNNNSSPFEIVKQTDFTTFDNVFKLDYEVMKSFPHKEFSSENHALSACQDSCGFPADQLHCTVLPEAGARGALQIQINTIPSSSINFGRIFHLNRPIHHGNSETVHPCMIMLN